MKIAIFLLFFTKGLPTYVSYKKTSVFSLINIKMGV